MDSAIYDHRLAYSMHIALKTDSGYEALNHNSGVFFAKATENEDGSLNAKSLKAPYAFRLNDGGYGIIAVRTQPNGETDEESIGSVLFTVTDDMLHYTEKGLIKLCDTAIDRAAAKYCQHCGKYRVFFETNGERHTAFFDPETLQAFPSEPKEGHLLDNVIESTGIEGAVPSCEVEIDDDVADKLIKKLTTPVNVSIDFPDQVCVSSAEELSEIKALATYSDGSTDTKRIDWKLDGVDFSKPGSYDICGVIHQDHYEFPFAVDRADPCMTKWNGKYYFIATDDASGNKTLYIRCADSIPGLITAPETLILDACTYEDIGGLLWAPEFHEINGKLYIFHAATPGEFVREESHIMELREGGDPMNRDDWSRPKRVTLKDGGELAEAGKTITLDMTTFRFDGKDYAVWSHRQFLPKDLGAWLCIAQIDSDDPRRLASDIVVLSKPDYGWANNHTFVEEGPYAMDLGDKLWLSFSGAAVDSTYVVGFLTIEKGKDPLDPKNWSKINYPVLTSRSVDGIYGPGHNAYVIDDDGKVWNTFHARPGVDGPRSSGIRRVHFDIYGEPVLDMTEEMDIKPELKNIKTKLIIK